jgi:hypothetical protein
VSRKTEGFPEGVSQPKNTLNWFGTGKGSISTEYPWPEGAGSRLGRSGSQVVWAWIVSVVAASSAAATVVGVNSEEVSIFMLWLECEFDFMEDTFVKPGEIFQEK